MASFLAPIINNQQLDANGNPLSGGTIDVYLAGSSTPVTTYSNKAGTVANTNPLTLNTLGLNSQGAVWLTGGALYKFVVKDAAGVVIRTAPALDNLSGIGDTTVSIDQWIVYQSNPVYVSATSFIVSGDQTQTFQPGRRIKTTNTGGVVYSAISASVYSAPNTTVTVVNDSGVLDSGLSAVSYGIISVADTSLPGFFNVGQCRLAKSGANLVLSRYGGNGLTINGVGQRIPAAGVSLAATSLTPSTLYYIYAYINSSGVMALEASTTTHAVDATTGMEIKLADPTRTLVGMARPITGPAWQDTTNQRFVASWFNRFPSTTYNAFSTNRTTTNTSLSEVNTEIRNEFLVWPGALNVQLAIDGYCTNNTIGGVSQTAIAIDGAQATGYSATTAYAANTIMPVSCHYFSQPGEGYHYATLWSATTAATTTLYPGGASFSVVSLKGVVFI